MVYNQYGVNQHQHQAGPSQSYQGQQYQGQQYQGSHPNPVPGMPIKNPRVRPARGQVITHYEVFQPQAGCCQWEGLSTMGWLSTLLLTIFFPPFCFIPCLVQSCFETQQRPVYGNPAGGSSQQNVQREVPMAQPAHEQPHGQPVNYSDPAQYSKPTQPAQGEPHGEPANYPDPTQYPKATQPPV